MSVSDYNTDPDLNTSISGINIAEGCPPSGINNAIRQLMADVKTQVDTDGTTYLPLSGGQMTGPVKMEVRPTSASGQKQIQFKNGDGTLTGSVECAAEDLGIGWAWSTGDGATLSLRSKNHQNGGNFDLIAKSGNTYSSLSGTPVGELTWDGHVVSNSGSENAFTHKHPTSGMEVRFGIGSGGVNRGLYQGTGVNDWLLYWGSDGEFRLRTVDGSSVGPQMYGTKGGWLSWDGKQVDTIDSSGSGWIRYVNGLQICWGTISFSGQTGTVDKSVTYPKAFNANPAATLGPAWAYGSEKGYFTSYGTTGFTLRGENTNSNSHSYNWIAIGYWK